MAQSAVTSASLQGPGCVARAVLVLASDNSTLVQRATAWPSTHFEVVTSGALLATSVVQDEVATVVRGWPMVHAQRWRPTCRMPCVPYVCLCARMFRRRLCLQTCRSVWSQLPTTLPLVWCRCGTCGARPPSVSCGVLSVVLW